MPEEGRDLALYMCHLTSMQQSTYNDLIKSSRAVRSSNIVRKILTSTELTAKDLEEPEIGMPI